MASTDSGSAPGKDCAPRPAEESDAPEGLEQATIPAEQKEDRRAGEDVLRNEEVLSVFGDYELLEKIAHGGMGVVYRARQKRLNRIVALKMIRESEWADEPQIQRFLAEARAAARLEHTGIVPIFEVGDHNGQHYYSMAFIDGGSLAARIRERPLRPREAVTIVEQVTRAVAHAHQHGVIHRDLKPANILLDRDGHPKVTDFGLARHVSDSHITIPGQILGTPSYMSPEQAAGRTEVIGPAADIYSLGALLYTALTGRPPFQAATALETMQQVQHQEPVAPRQLNAAVPRDLETICLKCLQKESARRYSSAEALADDLHRFLAGEPIHARPVGAVERWWRWCRRYPAAAGLILSLCLGTIIAVTLTIWALGERDRANSKASEADQATQSEAEQRRRAETELARSLVASVRELRVSAPPGWTWTGLERLEAARKLEAGGVDPVETRSLLAECLGRADVRQVGVLAEGIMPAALAFTPDGKAVAVGQTKSALICSVQVCDLATRKLLRTFTFSSAVSSLDRLFSGSATKYQEGICSLTYSPDGKWLVAGTRSGKICRWDTTTGKDDPVSWQAHESKESVTGLTFSPDGKRLISCGAQSVMEWKPDNDWKGTRLETVGATQACFTPDGAVLALAADRLRLLVGERRQAQNTIPASIAGRYLAMSPDGLRLATETSTAIHLVDVAHGELYSTLLPADVSAGAKADGLQFSSDGSLLVSTWGNNRVHLWDVASGKRIAELFIPDREDPLPAFSPDGRYLVVAADRRTLLYELRPSVVQSTIAQHSMPVKGIDFTDHGELAVASERAIDDAIVDTFITVWDPASGRRQRTAQVITIPGQDRRFKPRRGCLCVQPGGNAIVAASSVLGPCVLSRQEKLIFPALLECPDRERSIEVPCGAMQLPPTDAELRDDPRASAGRALRLAPGGAAIRFRIPQMCRKSPSDGWAAVAAIRVELKGAGGPAIACATLAPPNHRWERDVDSLIIPDGEYHWYLCEIMNTKDAVSNHEWLDVTVSVPEKATAAQAVWLDRVFLYPFKIADWPRSLEPGRECSPLAFSPDGSRLWGVYDGDRVLSWHAPGFKSATRWKDVAGEALFGFKRMNCLAAGNRWVLIGTESGMVHVISPASGLPENQWAGPSGIRAIALHPTEALAVLGTQKGQAQVIRIPDGEVVADLPGHAQSIESAVFSRDGNLLVTASLDHTVRLWRTTGAVFKPILSLPAPTGQIVSVRLSPSADKLAILTRPDRAVRVWDLARLRTELERLGVDWPSTRSIDPPRAPQR